MKKILPLLLLLPLIAFMNSGCDNESNAQQNVEETETLAVDFLQNIISGSVGEKISENEYLFELTLSPNTVFTADMPRRKAGSITTEKFYDNFNINFPESFPNAILAINEGATPSGVPFEMKNPIYNPSTGVLEVIISPLETTSDAGEGSVNLIDIEDIISPFGQSSLFIDDATNTCAGLTQGMCSTGNNVGGDCSGDKCCFLDGQCLDPTATCDGGSPGVCSVTGEDCVSEECCTSELGCLDAMIIPL
ncbi:MAG: hypothetical protein N2A97_05565 [Thermodesulfobacteriales bacterium]